MSVPDRLALRVFRVLDTDYNERLDLQETFRLVKSLKATSEIKDALNLLQMTDKDRDNLISFSEFKGFILVHIKAAFIFGHLPFLEYRGSR